MNSKIDKLTIDVKKEIDRRVEQGLDLQNQIKLIIKNRKFWLTFFLAKPLLAKGLGLRD